MKRPLHRSRPGVCHEAWAAYDGACAEAEELYATLTELHARLSRAEKVMQAAREWRDNLEGSEDAHFEDALWRALAEYGEEG